MNLRENTLDSHQSELTYPLMIIATGSARSPVWKPDQVRKTYWEVCGTHWEVCNTCQEVCNTCWEVCSIYQVVMGKFSSVQFRDNFGEP